MHKTDKAGEIHSMTGYGRASASPDIPGEASVLTIELRSFNARGKKINVRTPPGYAAVEPKLFSLLSESFARGSIDCKLYIQGETGAKHYRVNTRLMQKYLVDFIGFRTTNELPGKVDIGLLAGLPGVVVEEEEPVDAEKMWKKIEPVFHKAVANLKQMRAVEGAAMATRLRASLDEIEGHRKVIENLAADVTRRHIKQWRKRIESLLRQTDGDIKPVKENIEREMVFFADRSDISEELVRLASHVAQFGKTLDEHGPVGKKLEFLAQELLREFNTIGSKANDSGEITALVVEAKTAVERIRELTANIE